MLKFRFFNPYGVSKSKSKSNPKSGFTKTPCEPGDIQFWVSKTRNSQNITICSLVTHIIEDPSVPQRDFGKYKNITVDQSDLLKKDTNDNRCKWFKEALNKLSSTLAENIDMRPKLGKVCIEGEMLLNGEEKFKTCSNKMQSVDEFTWLLQTMGLETTVVYREKLGLVNCTIVEETKHLPFNGLDDTMWPFPETR